MSGDRLAPTPALDRTMWLARFPVMFITGFPPTALNGWFFWLLVGLWAVLIVFSYFIGKE